MTFVLKHKEIYQQHICDNSVEMGLGDFLTIYAHDILKINLITKISISVDFTYSIIQFLEFSNKRKHMVTITKTNYFLFEQKGHVKKFLKYMNSRHCNIQFTCEEDSNDKFSFLDITLAYQMIN